MKKIAIVFAIVGLLFGVACAAESEKEVTIIAKPQVPEQTIKIELEVPDIKVDIPPVKIEPATSQVDVGTVITQVEGYYNNALNRIFNTITLWFAFIGVGVTVVLWYLGKREKKRQTDFNKNTAELRDLQKIVGIQISKHGLLEGRVEKQLSDLEDLKVRLEESESEEKPKTVSKKEGVPKPAMELKILNTLWKRQMLKYPELNGSWGFKIDERAPEFLEFRDASNRLIGECLISKTETDHFLKITIDGLRYCAGNPVGFSSAGMWFEDVPIPEDKRNRFFEKLRQDGIMK